MVLEPKRNGRRFVRQDGDRKPVRDQRDAWPRAWMIAAMKKGKRA